MNSALFFTFPSSIQKGSKLNIFLKEAAKKSNFLNCFRLNAPAIKLDGGGGYGLNVPAIKKRSFFAVPLQ